MGAADLCAVLHSESNTNPSRKTNETTMLPKIPFFCSLLWSPPRGVSQRQVVLREHHRKKALLPLAPHQPQDQNLPFLQISTFPEVFFANSLNPTCLTEIFKQNSMRIFWLSFFFYRPSCQGKNETGITPIPKPLAKIHALLY